MTLVSGHRTSRADMTGHHPDYFDGRLRPYISPNIINVLFSFAIFMIQKVSNKQARLTCHTHFAINFFFIFVCFFSIEHI